MAIIYSYQENEELRNSDMLVGTASTLHNGQVRKVTKNFTLGQLKQFVSTGGLILSNGGTSGPATLIDNVLNIPVYQGAITLTTTGSTGSATLIGNTLNIPVYSGGVVYTFNAPLTEASGTVSISQANTTTNGYLSSTDWNTFYGKQNALSGTGVVKSTAGTISYINGTSTQYIAGDGSLITFPAIPSITPAALTRTNDTNVTLTLGGTPNTALLQGVSLTLGWDGTLADSRIASAATWNAKQNAITLTTTGSGAATFIGSTLNIPTPPAAAFASLTTTGSSGSSTLISGVLNVPTYTLAGLGGQTALSGTGIVKSTAGTISYINGTTAEYVRGDGSLATFPTTTVPTLNQVLTAGNTSIIDANIGTLGIWDVVEGAYAKISSTDNLFVIKDPLTNTLLSMEQGTLYLNKTNSINAKISTGNLTSSRTFYFPDATGTIALLTSLSSTATGLTYTNTTGVFSLTAGYSIPTTSSQTNWDTAYTNRITSLTTTGTGAATLIANVLNIPTPPTATFTSLTTTGSSGSSTLTAGVLNVPTYTLTGLGGVPTSRTLTINGTAYDLTADRSWSVGTVTSVTATSPITSTGGTTPVISTSMATNKLIGRSTAGTGVMEEITVGSGLALSGGTLSSSALSGSILHGIAAGTDTYTVTIAGATAYADGDAYLINFTNGNTTSCTLNINGQGAIALWRNNDGSLIGGDIVSGGEILCVYRAANNVFQCIGTAPNTLLAYVTNAETSTITKGQAVYVSGGTGDRIKVKLAYNTSDATSAQTIGIVQSTSIAANQKGLIIVQGQLDNLSLFPTATWADGDFIYLGATPGTLTNVKPFAPNHLVYLGYVTTASNGSAGRMYVKVQNGYEMNEIHDVYINPATLANGDLLQYNSSTDLWENESLSTAGIQAKLNGTGFVKASGTTISYDNTTYYPYPTGTTSQYVRGDGSLATFPTGVPTLNEVLTVGNTSLLSANVGELGLWDSVNSNYITLGTTDQGVTFNVPSVGEIFLVQNDVISFGDGALASITNNLLTAPRVFQLPNASGTLALTSDITTPTLNDVLTAGNTSLIAANAGTLGVWDNVNSGYMQIRAIDNSFLFEDSATNKILSAEQGIFSIYKSGTITANLNTTLLTASRTYNFPNASGTLALTSDISGFISGSGTTNYVPRFSSASSITDSQIFDSGTNVGIGTSSPSAKLFVADSLNTYAGAFKGTGGTSFIALGTVAGNVPAIKGYTAGFVGPSDIVLQNGGGNVGIGTTNIPYGNLALKSNSATTYGGFNVFASSNDRFVAVNHTGTVGVIETESVGYSPSDLTIRTNGSERMRITTNGNVGIGTTNPSGKLQVASATAGDDQIWLQSATYTGGYSTLGYNANTGEFRIKQNDGGSAGITFYTGASASEKMRITPSGYVGIGQTNPSALLDVAGDALINGVTVGRGAGNVSTNTVVGSSAFTNNSSGADNVIIGVNTGTNINGGNGNTIIGANNYLSPTGISTDYSDTLSISKRDSSLSSYLPHIWAPEKVSTNATVDVITVDYSIYRAMFVEYIIEDEDENIRGGYIKGIWNSDATIIKMTEETTSSIGLTEDYEFNIIQSTTDTAILQLTSYSGNPVYCSVTSRLLTRPY